MNTQEKIEYLVFEKYGLKKGDPLSIKSQLGKLFENLMSKYL